MAPRRSGSWAVAAWALTCAAAIQAFVHFDWDFGVVRGLLLLGLGALCAAARFLPRNLAASPKAARLAMAATLLFLGQNLSEARHSYLSARKHGTEWEMGAINERAARLLFQGVNPYGRNSYLDSGQVRLVLADPGNAHCFATKPEVLLAAYDHFWATGSAAEHAGLDLEVSGAPGCAAARAILQQAGVKYGPVMLLQYAPFVAALGKAGISLSHLLVLLLLCGLVARSARERSGSPLVGWLAPLLILGPSLVRLDFLFYSDCDLAPVTLAFAGLLALERKRERTGALLLGLSVAAKLLPGALFVPLLLRRSAPKAWVVFALVLAAAFGPFLLWDARGLLDNQIWFNVDRSGDSTAISFYLPAAARLALTAATALVALLALRRREGSALPYLLAAHLGFLLGAKLFHNNYVLWLLPLLGAWLGESTRAAEPGLRPSWPRWVLWPAAATGAAMMLGIALLEHAALGTSGLASDPWLALGYGALVGMAAAAPQPPRGRWWRRWLSRG